MNRWKGTVGGMAVALLLGVLLNYLIPEDVFLLIASIATFATVWVWIMILVTHLRFRKAWQGRKLPVRMPFFPIAQITGIALLGAILVTMGLDTEFWNISWIVGVPWLIGVSLVYFIYRKRLAQAALGSAVGV